MTRFLLSKAKILHGRGAGNRLSKEPVHIRKTNRIQSTGNSIHIFDGYFGGAERQVYFFCINIYATIQNKRSDNK